MKRILFLLVVVIGLNVSVVKAEEWTVINLPAYIGNILCEGFIDSTTGCVGGDGLWRTSNGGETWSNCISNVYNISNIKFVGQTGYVISHPTGWYGSHLWKTINGGITWIKIYDSYLSSINFGKIFIINEDSVLVTVTDGPNSYVWMTSNGGQNWETVFSTSEIYLISALFQEDDRYVATQGHLWVNVGGIWEIRNNGDLTCFSNICADQDKLYIAGQKFINGLFHFAVNMTSDKGQSWNTSILDQTEQGICYNIVFQNSIGYAVGAIYTDSSVTGKIYKKVNSQDWSQVYELSGKEFFDISVTEHCIYFIGRGVLVRYTFEDTPLPIELSSFISSVNVNTITLNWVTTSEINNAEFQLERKCESDWEAIGYIEGHGTSICSHTYQFTDKNLQTGKYTYRLKQIDFNGNFEYFNLTDEVVIGIPEKYSLSQNYPNPFNPNTTIGFKIPISSKVRLMIYDISGKEIQTLIDEYKDAGYYETEFNGSNLSSGVFFYRIEAGEFTETKKMSLIK